jgi:hypothetical protein
VILNPDQNADTPKKDTAAGADAFCRPTTGTITGASNTTTFATIVRPPASGIMPRPLKARPPSCSQTAEAALNVLD